MSTIDSRIVTMKFDNAAFQKGVASTMSALEQLKAKLSGGFSAKGPGDITKNMNIAEAGARIDGLSAKFLALGTVAVTALSQITTSALQMGKGFVTQFTGISAAADGFSDYELKIQAVQTIMSGTGASIEEVSKHLKRMDKYADDTIYSLRDMTGNISKFTNAGVKLPVAVDAMIGIANAAALAGANSEEAARAMYNLGQAIGQGHVKLIDWKSVELANMGTVEFKQQLIDTAVAMGTLNKVGDNTYKTLKGTEVTTKNFTTTLSDQWLTAEALTKTLGNYADKNTEIGEKAWKAATQVKTFSMMVETLKAAAGTGWTDTFEIVIGNLPKATKLWTDMSFEIAKVIGNSADARNKILKDWQMMGGRAALIKSVSNIFKALGRVLIPIHQAFREIFPRKTGAELASMTKAFKRFTRTLIISKETSEDIKNTFKGVFAIISIASQIIGGLIKWILTGIHLFVTLGGAGDSAAGGILNFTGGIGEMLASFDEWLKKGKYIQNFFDKVIAGREKIFGPILRAVGDLVGKFFELAGPGIVSAFQAIWAAGGRLAPLFEQIGAVVEKIWEVIGVGAYYAGGAVYLAGEAVSDFFSKVKIDGDTVKDIISSIASFFSDLGGAIANIIPSFGSMGKGIDETNQKFQLTASAGDAVMGFFEGLGGAIEWIANTIGNIGSGIWNFFRGGAAAIGKFAGSVDILDLMAALNFAVLASFAFTMRRFLKDLSSMFDNIGEAFGGVTSHLKAMQNGVKAQAIKAIAVAVALLVAALFVLSIMNIPALQQGMIAITILLVELSLAMKAITKSLEDVSMRQMFGLSAALIALAAALLIISAAVFIFGKMDPKTFSDGMIRLSIALLVIVAAAVALGSIEGKLFSAAAGIIVLTGAMVVLSAAIAIFAKMDPDTFSDGLIRVGLALLVLVTAAIALGTIKGAAFTAAAGIAAMATALMLLLPVIAALGTMDGSTIAQGLIVIAVALALLLGAAAIAAIPLVTAGLAALGLTLLAIGAAAFLVASAFGIFVAAAVAFVAMIVAISATLPVLIVQWGLAWKTLLTVLVGLIPEFVAFVVALIAGMANTVIQSTTVIGNAFLALLKEGLRVIVSMFDNFIDAGFQLLTMILRGIERNIGDIVNTVGSIITKFLRAMADKMPDIAEAGAELLVELIEGIEKAVNDGDKIQRMTTAGLKIAEGLVKGVASGIWDYGVGAVNRALDDLLSLIPPWARKMLGINSPAKVMIPIGEGISEGVAYGIGRDTLVKSSIDELGKGAVRAMKEAMAKASGITLESMDIRPTVTPILDLTQMTKDASAMSSLLAVGSVKADVSFNRAAQLSEDIQQRREETASTPVVKETKIELTQNNTSPKALDSVDIYRQTNNQLSLLKEALKDNVLQQD